MVLAYGERKRVYTWQTLTSISGILVEKTITTEKRRGKRLQAQYSIKFVDVNRVK